MEGLLSWASLVLNVLVEPSHNLSSAQERWDHLTVLLLQSNKGNAVVGTDQNATISQNSICLFL